MKVSLIVVINDLGEPDMVANDCDGMTIRAKSVDPS